MTNEPQTARDYDSRATQAVRTVLIELGQVLGDYLEALVIIGGAVPWLLLTEAEVPHVGTIDVDFALDPNKLNSPRYAALVALLEGKGYERQLEGIETFQLRKMIRVDQGEPVAVTLDLLKPAKPKTKRNRPPLIPNFRVVDADGAEFALLNPRIIELEGVMPDGRNNTVRLPVADLASFLVMKGYALTKRDKPKDAYDIYYVIKYYPGGIEELAELCKLLIIQNAARVGYLGIASKFKNLDDFGPQTVVEFLSETLGTREGRDFLQRDVYAQVNAWLKILEIGSQ
jgi:hypothetical protein